MTAGLRHIGFLRCPHCSSERTVLRAMWTSGKPYRCPACGLMSKIETSRWIDGLTLGIGGVLMVLFVQLFDRALEGWGVVLGVAAGFVVGILLSILGGLWFWRLEPVKNEWQNAPSSVATPSNGERRA